MTLSAAERAAPPATVPWLAIVAGCLIAMLTFGPRSAIGFFQLPMLAEKGWSREDFAIAIALQNLFWGAGQPLFGAIADKYGTARVLVLSGVLYAAWRLTPGGQRLVKARALPRPKTRPRGSHGRSHRPIRRRHHRRRSRWL